MVGRELFDGCLICLVVLFCFGGMEGMISKSLVRGNLVSFGRELFFKLKKVHFEIIILS